mmetsp:Transcript_19186/g.24397  ORF Transcript_19186/g.24397 Transcript_19186/m.24397 type:complete len:101 (-) Transcript_19186:13-315(-)
MSIALSYYQQAADMGLADSYSSLAHMYAQGLGTKQDNLTAFEYYRKAVANNAPSGHIGLGYYYLYGGVANVKVNTSLALFHYEKAAENNITDAHSVLGVL